MIEYKTLEINKQSTSVNDRDEMLCELGKDNWELVSVTPITARENPGGGWEPYSYIKYLLYTFKRVI